MSNQDQIAYWSGPVGDTWVAMGERLDKQLDPLGQVTLRALAPKPGERLADIGCGAGQTTSQLAATGAQVMGVDVSAPLLAAARQRFPGLSFVEADAAIYDFGELDAIFSRFGVMFFSDPVAAFTHFHRCLRPGGRIAFMCWRAVEKNPLMLAPIAAAVAAGIPAPPPGDPYAPGPFAFADGERLTSILTRAGFSDIQLTPHDESVGGNDLDAALDLALQIGPLGRLLRESPQHREAALSAVRATLATYLQNGVVMMPSATWVVTARK
ncbi:MAG TPA: class I SAM-dependent methyltransferase [Pseudomonadota bacterium]|nr:class I SAM-dependent methyltransferase [Pseudomonadota bacterium]